MTALHDSRESKEGGNVVAITKAGLLFQKKQRGASSPWPRQLAMCRSSTAAAGTQHG